ncbi:hypothetical protein T265_02532 [Opisthorchis viverrini]|uniref:Uncharacterized protein n=1 Tax=Opisthorchis viverrini TaxID=6198 RepID=A0A075AI89_OPIVI|nr:hypothetical protein T265_02532 [Opisthorchis viverrini]KER31214.1 hypothetical protein T265_02532 [Opisthorchis viverrini]
MPVVDLLVHAGLFESGFLRNTIKEDLQESTYETKQTLDSQITRSKNTPSSHVVKGIKPPDSAILVVGPPASDGRITSRFASTVIFTTEYEIIRERWPKQFWVAPAQRQHSDETAAVMLLSKYCDLNDCPSLSSKFRLCTSGDEEATAAGYAKVGIVLSERAEASLLD